jgi:hypothetical protein
MFIEHAGKRPTVDRPPQSKYNTTRSDKDDEEEQLMPSARQILR